jgi:dTDP-4-dehydrorhamnose reductase
LKILILGASGLIGSTTLRVLSYREGWNVYGSIRSEATKWLLPMIDPSRFVTNLDVHNFSSVINVLQEVKPDVLINCIGGTKHKKEGNNPIDAIYLNSLLPHKLAQFCELINCRFIHISTDCVFSGKSGSYTESSVTDAEDVYGKSKALGEVDYGNVITLRTSTIGHELQTKHGLLDWFLSQNGSCKGFSKAVFSGFPTVVFAQIIRDLVLPHPELKGLFNVAAMPINKHDLLQLIAKIYDKQINIARDDTFRVDRSLNASKFNQATGYNPPSWQSLIETMYQYR